MWFSTAGVHVLNHHLPPYLCLLPQVRKVYRVLPAALARDQPGAVAEAAACFAALPSWDLQLLSQLKPQAEVGRGVGATWKAGAWAG